LDVQYNYVKEEKVYLGSVLNPIQIRIEVVTRLILYKILRRDLNVPNEYMNEIIVTVGDLNYLLDEHQEKVYEQILDLDEKIDI
jgi:hypothetical protein